MLGAAIGDIVGSSYENITPEGDNFEFFTSKSRPTDDSWMTLAVSETLLDNCPLQTNEESLKKIQDELSKNLVKWYIRHPGGDYEDMFLAWLQGLIPKKPFNSQGVGAAMRVSSIGWLANSIEEIKIISKAVTEITHNHKYGLRGAEAVAVCIYLARIGKSKQYIKEYVAENYYYLVRTLNYTKISQTKNYEPTCEKSVPQAIYSFLVSENFEDCIKIAVSFGRDCNTIASIACSIAEAYYDDIPQELINKTRSYFKKDELKIFDKINVEKIKEKSRN